MCDLTITPTTTRRLCVLCRRLLPIACVLSCATAALAFHLKCLPHSPVRGTCATLLSCFTRAPHRLCMSQNAACALTQSPLRVVSVTLAPHPPSSSGCLSLNSGRSKTIFGRQILRCCCILANPRLNFARTRLKTDVTHDRFVRSLLKPPLPQLHRTVLAIRLQFRENRLPSSARNV
jgi:hypothetical protein